MDEGAVDHVAGHPLGVLPVGTDAGLGFGFGIGHRGLHCAPELIEDAFVARCLVEERHALGNVEVPVIENSAVATGPGGEPFAGLRIEVVAEPLETPLIDDPG